MFGHLGENVHVDIDFRCEYGKNIFVGNKVIINMNCTFVDNNRIEIDNNVLIASNVQIYTATHSTNVKERTMQNWDESKAICNTFALPIKIEDNVWIGGGAIILPGVTIGRNSVIGAGSVVTRLSCKLFSNNSSRVNCNRVSSNSINYFYCNFFYNSNAISSFGRFSGFIATRSERHCKCNSEEQN